MKKTYHLEKKGDDYTVVVGSFKLVSSTDEIKVKHGRVNIHKDDLPKYDIVSLGTGFFSRVWRAIQFISFWLSVSIWVAFVLGTIAGGINYFLVEMAPYAQLDNIILYIFISSLIGIMISIYLWFKEEKND